MSILVVRPRAETVQVWFSEADAHLILSMPWCIDSQGYASTSLNVNNLHSSWRLHRLVLGLRKGDGITTDHINGDKLDNRRHNLRATTSARNTANQAIVNNKASSRFRGVYLSDTGRWVAQARVEQRAKHIGTFDREEDAAAAVARFREAHGIPPGY